MALLCLAALALPGEGRAAGEGGEEKGASATAPPPHVELESLFRLPRDTPLRDEPSVGGATRERWQERFAAARAEVSRAEQQLADAQRQLEEVASNSEAWQVTAPGVQKSAENSPLSYKLRQDIRRGREEVERAERELRELETEASLAGVPEEWRRPPPRHEDAAPGAP